MSVVIPTHVSLRIELLIKSRETFIRSRKAFLQSRNIAQITETILKSWQTILKSRKAFINSMKSYARLKEGFMQIKTKPGSSRRNSYEAKQSPSGLRDTSLEQERATANDNPKRFRIWSSSERPANLGIIQRAGWTVRI
jgi:hypothetical protein